MALRLINVLHRQKERDFRRGLTQFSEKVKTCVTPAELGGQFIHTTNTFLPIERVGFFTMHQPKMRLQLASHKGFEMLERHSVPFEAHQLRTDLMLPVALQERVDPDVKVEPADVEVFERWDIEVVFPIVEPQKEILGFLVLGRKESGELYTREDMEYLGLMSAQAALAMGRIALQEKLILQNAEKEKLEEVSELKSLFVASVSHELKTPLTSIKIMSELLQSGTGLSREKIHEYAHIIEGESDRLTRLINNVLDFSKIERGIKVYSFAEVDLNDIVKDSINVMKYQFELEGFTLRHTQSKVPLTINADKDAIRSALINVLSNAMKYSHNEKVIDVYTFKRERHVGVTIADRGIGIPNEERLRIFDQFYRGESKHTRNVGGLGLGLAIVKHVMDAHGGEINVFSEVGKESKFELLFPAFGDE